MVNKRPEWCPHSTCIFVVNMQDKICGGHLPEPVEHDGDYNIHRLCLEGALPNGEIFDLQIHNSDIFCFNRVFSALRKEGEK